MKNTNEQEIIKSHFSKLGKKSWEKNKRSPEYMRGLQKKSVEARKRNKLSTNE